MEGKRCFTYCGDDRCDCEAGPRFPEAGQERPSPTTITKEAELLKAAKDALERFDACDPVNQTTRPDRYTKAASACIAYVRALTLRPSGPDPNDAWRPIDSAPRDGTPIVAWTVHVNAKYSKDPVGEGWAAPSIIRWIDHNGGGWTWEGLCGEHVAWLPMPASSASQAAEG